MIDLLLVEDNEEIMRGNKRILTLHGYVVRTAETLAAAWQEIERKVPDLLVLDLMMPDGNGLEFCAELRKTQTLPVLMLTALGQDRDEIKGLRAGGDDYLSKPYRYGVLLARIEALLRRTAYAPQVLPALRRIGPLCIDTAARQAAVDGEDLLLSPKEFALLERLLTASGQFISADSLYETLWGRKAAGDVRTVREHIHRLRGKLRNVPELRLEGVRGKGYRLNINNN